MKRKKTIVLKIDPRRPDKKIIAIAADALRAGKLVAFPTETVYGLGANILDEKAVARLYAVKERPAGKPFTVLICDVSLIKESGCEITAAVEALIGRYWPGPLTVILQSSDGRKTGFRMPANKAALLLIRQSGVPVAAPSANISGRTPPTRPKEVLEQLGGRIDILLDAGPTDVGVESTVVDMSGTPPKILREGAIKTADILKVING